MRFKKFWNKAKHIQTIASVLSLLTFFLLTFTPLFLRFMVVVFAIAERLLLLENGLGPVREAVALVIFVTPMTLGALSAGLASRLTLASLRFGEFKLLRYRLRRLERQLADQGHPYRVAPEDSRMRVRVAEGLEDDMALHAELQKEFMEMAS